MTKLTQEMLEVEYEVVHEEVPVIEEGEPQKVKVETITIHDTGSQNGLQRVRTLSNFRASESGDGFEWANASPVRYKMYGEEVNTSFHMFHVLGVERAVKYIEEKYGPVVKSYPTLTEPDR